MSIQYKGKGKKKKARVVHCHGSKKGESISDWTTPEKARKQHAAIVISEKKQATKKRRSKKK